MAEGVAEIVFAEKDLPHLRSIYPEITDYLEEKLEDPQWLSELNERLDALAEAYEENHSIMLHPSSVTVLLPALDSLKLPPFLFLVFPRRNHP